jgi:hypothetical protein
LILLDFGPPNSTDEVVASVRKESDRRARKSSKRQKSLDDLQRLAAELSDKELWQELERECRDFLGEAERGSQRRPPDWLIMLAREVGRRQGKEGLMAVIQMQEALEEESPSGASRDFEQKLWAVLVYGAFGGWSSVRPAEALREVLRNRPDPFEEDDSRFPRLFINPAMIDGFVSADYRVEERVLRDAFERVAESDLDLAMELLIQGTDNISLDPNQMVEVFLPHLDSGQREGLFDRLLLQRKREDGPSLFHPQIWSEDWSVLRGDHAPRDVIRLTEVIGRVMPDQVGSLLADSSIPSQTREMLGIWGFLHHPDQAGWIGSQSIEFQQSILSALSVHGSLFSIGPVDGRSIAHDDLPEFSRSVRVAIERSHLPEEEREALIRRTDENYPEPQ